MNKLDIDYLNDILFSKINIDHDDENNQSNKYMTYLNIFSTIILPEILENGVKWGYIEHVKNFMKNNILFSRLLNFDAIEYLDKKTFSELNDNLKPINYSIYIGMQEHTACIVFDISFKDRIIFRILNAGFKSEFHTSINQIECNCAIEYIHFFNNNDNDICPYVMEIYKLFGRFVNIKFKQYDNLY